MNPTDEQLAQVEQLASTGSDDASRVIAALVAALRDARAEVEMYRVRGDRLQHAIETLCDQARRCHVQPESCEQHREVTVAQIRAALAAAPTGQEHGNG